MLETRENQPDPQEASAPGARSHVTPSLTEVNAQEQSPAATPAPPTNTLVPAKASTHTGESTSPTRERLGDAKERLSETRERLVDTRAKLHAHRIDPTRRAPQAFRRLTAAIHALVPSPIAARISQNFIGYALINGSAFLLDITLLWLLYERAGWWYPLAVTVGYAVAGLYSFSLNRWLNFQAKGHLVAQGSRYVVGLVSQYVIFILGLSTLLHWLGMNAELARFLSACCEGLYLYTLLRLWVFRRRS